MSGSGNFMKLREIFEDESSRHELKGVMGVAAFDSVYNELLLVQQTALEELCGGDFVKFMEDGSLISIAYAFPEYAINAIGLREGDGFDKEAWNIYAHEYHRLNDALDRTAARLVEEAGGIAIPATVGVAGEVDHVEDFYGLAVSHRVVAEQAGIGWRGKNELIVNLQYSCAIRLASVVTLLPLEPTAQSQGSCSSCRACMDACSFLRLKERLDNYREQCRRYIVYLELDADVCGKCVKACYRDSIYSNQFSL